MCTIEVFGDRAMRRVDVDAEDLALSWKMSVGVAS